MAVEVDAVVGDEIGGGLVDSVDLGCGWTVRWFEKLVEMDLVVEVVVGSLLDLEGHWGQ